VTAIATASSQVDVSRGNYTWGAYFACCHEGESAAEL